jgi:BlaI family penicillinase repressor
MAAENPTELELRILKVLWERSPLTARQIREVLAERRRELAHTSVITMLQRMVDKGQLDRLDPEVGKAFRFVPLLSKADVSGRMLGDLVDRVFDGSAEAVMLSLFDVSDLDSDSLKGLRRAFDRKVREKNNG